MNIRIKEEKKNFLQQRRDDVKKKKKSTNLLSTPSNLILFKIYFSLIISVYNIFLKILKISF